MYMSVVVVLCTQETYCCLLSKREAALRKFDTLTSSIKELGNWLFDNDCQIVAMESTGAYWKPIYKI